MAGGSDKALQLLKTLPRVGLSNIKPIHKHKGSGRGDRVGRGKRGKFEKHNLPPLGVEGGQTPFYLLIPKEPYYKDFAQRRQLPYVSLLQLQRLVDVGMLDPARPVDLTALSRTPLKPIEIANREYGFNLTDEGVDEFAAKLNVEVQHASELAIAAVERNGGTINTKFYDLQAVEAMVNPRKFFMKGLPIPSNKLPPQDTLKYYMEPKNRGYLADPSLIDDARFELAQKYGYTLPDLKEDPDFDLLTMRKRPEQIWYGLEPGWVVNLADRQILRARRGEEAREYYEAQHVYG